MRPLNFIALAMALAACGGDDESETAPPTGTNVQAFMTHYFETFDSYVSADIVALFSGDVHADISGLGMLDGITEVRDQWLVPFTTAFPDYAHNVDQITVVDQTATADFVFHGTHQAPLLDEQPTGKELTLPIHGTYEIANDVVVSFKLEYDTQIVLDAITP